MKVVTCTHCGKKYRLEDYEDIDEYECTVCAGTLSLSEEYETEDKKKTHIFNPYNDNPDINIVECTNCGLRYQLKKDQNIFDYVCTSCDSPLKYLDEDLNNEMNQIVEENIKYTPTSSNTTYVNPNEEDVIYVDHNTPDTTYTNHNEEDVIYVDHNTPDTTYTNHNEEDVIYVDHNTPDTAYVNHNDDENTIYIDNSSSEIYTEHNTNFSQDDIIIPEHNLDKSLPSKNEETNNTSNEIDTKIRKSIEEKNKPFNETLKENTASVIGSITSAFSRHSKPKIPKGNDYNSLHKYIKNQFLENVNNEYDVYEELHNGEKKNSKLLKRDETPLEFDTIKSNMIGANTVIENGKIINKYQSKENKQVFGKKNSLDKTVQTTLNGSIYKNKSIGKPLTTIHTPPIEKEIHYINPNKQKQNLVPQPNEKKNPYSYVYIGVGTFSITVGFLDSILSQRNYSAVFIVIGLVIFIIGLAKNKNFGESEERGRIIRDKLLTLPENYYVLYYVKVPESTEGINHVVVGPTGIYSIITQKFNEKEDRNRLREEEENNEIINSNEIIIKGKNTTDRITTKLKLSNSSEIEFATNNKIKQKCLKLTTELNGFLTENGFNNCPLEPMVGFVNKEVAVINIPLENQDLFLNELLLKITSDPILLDQTTVNKCAVLLSQYSTNCAS